MIESLSQFKKWVEVGKKIEFVKNVNFPERDGQVRTINKVQTNAIFTNKIGEDGEIGLYYIKAKDMVFENGLIKFIETALDKEAIKAFKEDGYEFISEDRFVWLVIRPVIHSKSKSYKCIECETISPSDEWNEATNEEYPGNTITLPRDFISVQGVTTVEDMNKHIETNPSDINIGAVVCPNCGFTPLLNELIEVQK